VPTTIWIEVAERLQQAHLHDRSTRQGVRASPRAAQKNVNARSIF
jgi:hypothetical protein